MNIHTYNTETVLSLIKSIGIDAKVITDSNIIKDIMDKFNPSCHNITVKSRKELLELHSCIEEQRPDILILVYYSEKTISYTNKVSPNTQVYVLEIDEDEKRISRYVDELEEMA